MPDSEIKQNIPTRNINNINRLIGDNKKTHKNSDTISSFAVESITVSEEKHLFQMEQMDGMESS